MTKIYDVTRPISPNLAVWPGDVSFCATVQMSIQQGFSVNVTTLTLSSHTGTHADAPYHFVDDGVPLADVSLTPFLGPATVVTVQKTAGPLTPTDFPDLDWQRLERLVIHSAASEGPLAQFQPNFVYPSPELADWLGRHNVLLFATDAPSVDAVNSKTLSGHHALQRNGIAILEGMLLTGVPDGNYELIALPLKIKGGDGSPVRAILRG